MAKEHKGRWNKRKNNNEAAYTGKDNINTPIALVKIIIRLLNYGRRSLKGCSPWGCWGLDTTEQLPFHFSLSCTGEGNGNPLQRSCLENPRDGGAWWAAVYGVAQGQARLKRLRSSSSSSVHRDKLDIRKLHRTDFNLLFWGANTSNVNNNNINNNIFNLKYNRKYLSESWIWSMCLEL